MAEEMSEKEIEASEERFRKGSDKYAHKAGYALNPDTKIVDTIVKGLARNRNKHGRAYCPCMFVSGDPEKDKEIICPCRIHKEDIEKKGKCHCGLFVKAE
jgi:ferredoxin-thioredoxin reductase catalytic subunit